MILADGIERLRVLGVRVLWASARDSAIGFYESMGMHVEGDGYLDTNTALPHHWVIIDLSAPWPDVSILRGLSPEYETHHADRSAGKPADALHPAARVAGFGHREAADQPGQPS